MTFACAKFIKPCIRHKFLCAVKTENVKNFSGDEVEKKKNVRIACGDGFCAAVLLFIGETEDKVTTFMTSTLHKRIKIPNSKTLDSPSDTDSEVEKRKHLKRKLDDNSTRENILNMKLLKVAATSAAVNSAIPAPLAAPLPAPQQQIKKGIPVPSPAPQQQMKKASSSASSGKLGDYNEVSNLKRILKEKEVELRKCKNEIQKLEQKLQDETDLKNDLLVLNMDLQRKVIGQFCNLNYNLQDLTEEVTEVANMTGKECAERVGAIKGDEIHLGRDVWIKKSVYNAIKGKSHISCALFVKEIAIAVFGTETLLVSTVTGGKSNRSKKKTNNSSPEEGAVLKLDPVKMMAIRDITYFWLITEQKKDKHFAELEKIKVSRYISHKISEIKRSKTKTDDVAVVGTEKETETTTTNSQKTTASSLNENGSGSENAGEDRTDKEHNDHEKNNPTDYVDEDFTKNSDKDFIENIDDEVNDDDLYDDNRYSDINDNWDDDSNSSKF